MKKLIISATLAAITISGVSKHDINALDFNGLSKPDQLQIKTQSQFISYGVGKNTKEITIHRHDEDNRNLSASERYDVYESNGNFKAGQSYKVIYNGDFITDIQTIN